MALKLTKDQTLTISWATLVSILGSLGAVWAFAAPIAGQAIDQKIALQIKPIQDAQIITITSTVRNLQNAIVALEFKRDTCTPKPDCWTVRDAQDLQSARNDLDAAQAALRGLRQ